MFLHTPYTLGKEILQNIKDKFAKFIFSDLTPIRKIIFRKLY